MRYQLSAVFSVIIRCAVSWIAASSTDSARKRSKSSPARCVCWRILRELAITTNDKDATSHSTRISAAPRLPCFDRFITLPSREGTPEEASLRAHRQFPPGYVPGTALWQSPIAESTAPSVRPGNATEAFAHPTEVFRAKPCPSPAPSVLRHKERLLPTDRRAHLHGAGGSCEIHRAPQHPPALAMAQPRSHPQHFR